MEWPEDAEELILRYGNRYEFDRCYVYENLNKFDTGVKRCCGLANRAVEQHTSEVWFNVLLGIGRIEDKWKTIVEQNRGGQKSE